MFKQKRKLLLWGLIVGGLMTYLFTRTQAPSIQHHKKVVEQFRTISVAEHSLNRHIMEAHFGVIKNYDPLNVAVTRVEKALKKLKDSKFAIHHRAGNEVKSALSDYHKIFTKRKKGVEHYKSALSIYKNATHYFPITGHKLLMKLKDDKKLHTRVKGLMVGILTFHMHHEEGLKHKPHKLHKELTLHNPKQFSKEEKEEWKIFLHNAKNILKTKKPIQNRMDALIRIPHRDKLKSLITHYNTYYEKLLYQVALYKLLLYVVATLLLLYAILILLKLSFASRVIEFHNKKLQRINAALDRFVPHEFLKMLRRESIEEVQLGDSMKKMMTVFFSDIRSFTSLSEKMTPEENFRFINSYLSEMGPIVKEHRGFIDKYIGDAIMALFKGDVRNAIHASNQMLRRLQEDLGWNTFREGELVRIGIGLHTGEMMLGTVGEANRMEGTVISDAVNLASRIEGLTKAYGVGLLISEDTYQLIEEPQEFNIRMIDRVKVKGKQRAVTIYEVFDCDTPVLKAAKQEYLTDFESAISMFFEGKLQIALDILRAYLEKVPDDHSARYHAKQITEILSKPDISVTQEWH